MKRYLTNTFQSGNRVLLIIDKDTIDFEVIHNNERHEFTARYENLDFFFDMRDIPDIYYYLMLTVLFSGLEWVYIPISDYNIKAESYQAMPLVSYSGGIDSTAALHLTQGKPVHITRIFDMGYENRQIKAVNYVNAVQIHTDLELLRTIYMPTKGFNIGIGYVGPMLPLLYFYKNTTIALGTVLEGIAFHYGEKLTYISDYSNTRTYDLVSILRTYGVNIIQPLCGCSEVITTQVAAKSGVRFVSSCHTNGSENFCKSCYKCFRKYGASGIKIPVDNALKKKLSTKPLPAALSAVYAIQKAGYRGDLFDLYRNIDVSAAERVDMNCQIPFGGGYKIEGFEAMTEADHVKINEFTDYLNSLK